LSIVFLEIAAKRPKTKTWLMCLSDKMNVVYFSMFFPENPPVFQFNQRLNRNWKRRTMPAFFSQAP